MFSGARSWLVGTLCFQTCSLSGTTCWWDYKIDWSTYEVNWYLCEGGDPNYQYWVLTINNEDLHTFHYWIAGGSSYVNRFENVDVWWLVSDGEFQLHAHYLISLLSLSQILEQSSCYQAWSSNKLSILWSHTDNKLVEIIQLFSAVNIWQLLSVM